MNELEIDIIPNGTVKKIVNYIMMNIDSPYKITNIQLFNEFQDDESKDIIGKALLDENYVMHNSKTKNYKIEANQVLSQLRIFSINHQINDIESKIKSSNEYSAVNMDLLNQQQILKKELLELKKGMKTI